MKKSREKITIGSDETLYFIYELYNGDFVDNICVHLLYESTDGSYDFEFYDSNTNRSWVVSLPVLCTLSEEELFQYSTVYEYEKYCSLDKLVLLQKVLLEHSVLKCYRKEVLIEY